ncbi:MAG: hypothetical protein K0U36_00155 [Alphaproteobacteria bacterium]|nr:hypothetical protein [Alphaproteobacteria bacterium]
MIDYATYMREALYDVVARVLTLVTCDSDLPGEHHFVLSFQTQYAGVVLPDELMRAYPQAIVIVLQYQFHSLSVDDAGMVRVTVQMKGVDCPIAFPLKALLFFADPSVNLRLSFETDEAEDGGNAIDHEDHEDHEDEDEDEDSAGSRRGPPRLAQSPVTPVASLAPAHAERPTDEGEKQDLDVLALFPTGQHQDEEEGRAEEGDVSTTGPDGVFGNPRATKGKNHAGRHPRQETPEAPSDDLHDTAESDNDSEFEATKVIDLDMFRPRR